MEILGIAKGGVDRPPGLPALAGEDRARDRPELGALAIDGLLAVVEVATADGQDPEELPARRLLPGEEIVFRSGFKRTVEVLIPELGEPRVGASRHRPMVAEAPDDPRAGVRVPEDEASLGGIGELEP
ncbi:MAG: hypothetical protein ACK55I_28100, partial [bacterium]